MFKKINPLKTLPAILSKGSLAEVTADPISNCSPEFAAKRVMLLLGCYRKGDCADPEVFVTAAIAVFTHYPEDVVRSVSDPHSGIPATSKWFPTIAELREACETVNLAAKRRVEQDARVKAQFAERERMEAMSDSDRRKAFIAGEMAKINAVLASNPDKPPPPIDIRDMEECAEKDRLRRKLDADIARQVERNKATPLTLSPAALSTAAGRAPMPVTHEAAE